ncbi:MAG: hypothetical protein Q4D03_06025 [Bacteroidales bacterium]|nr:hypothetical protein [Bacteroidales bacterium]
MEQNDDLLMQQVALAMKDIKAPSSVDMTDKVMSAIANKELLAPKKDRNRHLLYVSSAVASFLALVLGATFLFLPSANDEVNEQDLRRMVASTHDGYYFDEYYAESFAETIEAEVLPFFDSSQEAELQ